ncbi:MAG: bifunctional oligoribonuclease/PAP phosphatase NrnA [Pelolinea sp.]|nr:bifunctional oligoribonuclease/PAP phosphatase NrnA [Pelolinea sp.]
MTTRTTKTDQLHQKISDLLSRSSKPLILSHSRPDGDAIGSLIGLFLALQKKGKKPQMVIIDGVPRKFKFLYGSDQINRSIKDDFDLVITVDCADQKRVAYPTELPDIQLNIDHHITNELYAETNLVIPEQPATTAILAEYLPDWGFDVDKNSANALLMGMVTDTIGFRTSNVSPDFLRLAADLMEKGADLSSVYQEALTSQSLPASIVWGKALSRIKSEGNLAWTTITLEDRAAASYLGNDDADLTNHLSSLENIDIEVLFNEQKDGKVKVSWRSNAKHDVSKLAMQFNGGGHPPAAGAEIIGDLETVVPLVIGKTKFFMKGQI